MKFNKDDANVLLQEGEVKWQVVFAADHVSKSTHNESIKLNLKAIDSLGKVGFITTYLTSAWKIKQFLESAGRLDLFDKGELLAADCNSLTGRGLCKIERDPTGEHDDKNVIKRFIRKDVQQSFAPTAQTQMPGFGVTPISQVQLNNMTDFKEDTDIPF